MGVIAPPFPRPSPTPPSEPLPPVRKVTPFGERPGIALAQLLASRDQAGLVAFLRSTPGLSALVADLHKRGTLDRILATVRDPALRRDMLRMLGSGLDAPTRGLIEASVRRLGVGAELQYNLGRLGLPVQVNTFDPSPYAHLISSDPTRPFTGAGATGTSPTALSVPLIDELGRALHKTATVEKYSNPLGSLNGYLHTLSPDERRQQAELLARQSISSVEADSYGGAAPSRQQVIEAAAKQYNLDPKLVTSLILAEQRDQTRLEDAKDYQAAASILHGNTSIGLGQVVVSTAQRNELFSDLLSEETRKHLSHGDVARLLASDEFNIFAVAKYARAVADEGAAHDPATLPNTTAAFPGLDMRAYAHSSSTWPEANIQALASEYTSRAWDDSVSTGWGHFVGEAYKDVTASGVHK
jgi:hypothetical protein